MLGALGVTCGGARAQADGRVPESTGVEIGVRGGYGVPFGQRAAGAALSGPVEGAASPMIDLGYRFTPHLYLGVLFAYGILVLDEEHPQVKVRREAVAEIDHRRRSALDGSAERGSRCTLAERDPVAAAYTDLDARGFGHPTVRLGTRATARNAERAQHRCLPAQAQAHSSPLILCSLSPRCAPRGEPESGRMRLNLRRCC